MEGNSILHAFNNIYFAIFALFCFKLLIKISLALLTHFYIVKGNRKEAARIAEEIYGIAPGSWADRSPLHEAAFQGRLLSLKTLIAQGFNVNIVTIDRVSALHEACLGGHVACAKVLLENGAQKAIYSGTTFPEFLPLLPDKSVPSGEALLVFLQDELATDQNVGAEQQGFVYAGGKHHVNAVTVDGITPLFNACCSGSAACVNMLLEFGATPQLENHLASPIHEAVKRGHRECMEILVANDVDIDQEDSQHGTPLYVACMYQRTDCVKKLLELGASVDLGKRLDTPLHAAVRKSSAEAVNLLTDYGASLTRRNAEFKCALDLAAPNSKVEQALLLREGLDSTGIYTGFHCEKTKYRPGCKKVYRGRVWKGESPSVFSSFSRSFLCVNC